MKKRITEIYKQFCKETGRSGGILVHSSITEWHEYLAKELDKDFDAAYDRDFVVPYPFETKTLSVMVSSITQIP